MRIKIDREWYNILDVTNHGYLPLLTMDTGEEFYVAEDTAIAQTAAEEYWEDMANNDASEFICIVGASAIIAHLMNGRDFDDVIEELADPCNDFGSYDGNEREVNVCCRLIENELGFEPTVAYRCN